VSNRSDFIGSAIRYSDSPLGRGTLQASPVVRRNADDVEAGQLRRQNQATGVGEEWAQSLERPTHRASQPRGVAFDPARDCSGAGD
jgi:hypothetical protein